MRLLITAFLLLSNTVFALQVALVSELGGDLGNNIPFSIFDLTSAQAVVQFSFFEEKLPVFPYVGVGFAVIQAKGAIVGVNQTALSPENTGDRVTINLITKCMNIPTELGVGMNSPYYWFQLFTGYDQCVSGTSSLLFKDRNTTYNIQYNDSDARIRFFKLGGRAYYPVTKTFHAGLSLIWYKVIHRENTPVPNAPYPFHPSDYPALQNSKFVVSISVLVPF